jgi:hypothetical protein
VKTYSRREITDAAQQEEGFCLECGERQDFLEKRLLLGLCCRCGEQAVIEAALVERVFQLEEEE